MIIANRVDTLFHLNVEVQINEAYVVKSELPTWLDWHKRFRHIGVTGLQYIHQHNLVKGLTVDEHSVFCDCEACVQAKQSQTPFPHSTQQTTMYAGELTHTDLWGPACITATNGAQYYMTFIDDYSHHCTIKLLKCKSNTPEMVKEYIAFVERQLSSSPKAIQMDNGTEYINNDLKSLWEERLHTREGEGILGSKCVCTLDGN